MSDQQTKTTTVTIEEFHREPAGLLRAVTPSSPLVVTRDGKVRAYVFRDTAPADADPPTKS